MQKTWFLNVKKNDLLELEKYFINLTDKELKKREIKLKKVIEELFFKPVIVSIDDMDRFEQKEIKKKRPIRITWYDCEISYIPSSIRKLSVVLKIKS